MILTDAQAEPDQMHVAQRLDPAGQGYVDDHYRTCLTRDIYPGSAWYTQVTERLATFLPGFAETYGFDLYPETERMLPFFQMNCYQGTQHGHIGYHMDLGPMTEVEERKLSLSILLNDANTFAGGEIMLHDGDVYRPLTGAVAGEAIVFPSFTMHEVETVKHGDRWSLVLWLHGPRFR